MLAAAGGFVHARLRADLDEAVDASLRARADAAASAPGSLAAAPLGEPEESFAQLVSAEGRVVAGMRTAALDASALRRAQRGPVLVERRVAGVEGEVRMLARPAGSGAVAVVGQSLDDRDETLSGLVTAFAIAAPLAVALASLLGYALASAALAPVEAMRRRATAVSLTADERLPLPAARDELRRLGETLNGMIERLRSAAARERRFVADASHELRTPLAVVKAELEAALRTGDYGPDVHAALVAAVEECDRMTQLAEDLLVLARADEHGLLLRPERLAARELLESVRARFSDRAARAGRAIGVDAPPDLLVDADALRLRQALGNLVENALRHGRGEVVLSARAASGAVELETRDGGPGFEPGIAERAFERFTRGDGARSGDGAGLGLAIVRAVAEAHRGSVAIVPGPGATVRMWLPGAPQGPLSEPAYGASQSSPTL